MAHVTAMVALWPSFEKATENPYGSIDLGDGYLLLRPAEETDQYCLSHKEEALRILLSGGPIPKTSAEYFSVDGDDENLLQIRLQGQSGRKSIGARIWQGQTVKLSKVCNLFTSRVSLTPTQILCQNTIRFAKSDSSSPDALKAFLVPWQPLPSIPNRINIISYGVPVCVDIKAREP